MQRGNSTILLVVILSLVFVGAFAATGGTNISTKEPSITSPGVTIRFPSGGQSRDNLQLQTFGYVTPMSVKKTCKPDSVKQPDCECPAYERLTVICKEKPCPKGTADWWDPRYYHGDVPLGCAYWPVSSKNQSLVNEKRKDPACTEVCLGKPVIYLYPIEDMVVDVEVVTPGRIYISDPEYPEGGWKNVLAHPGGGLEYKGKEYHELYYETEVHDVKQPNDGIIIPSSQLKERLSGIVMRLGLKEHERDEFLDYWLPQLEELQSPFILFSVLDPVEKERVDHVEIAPKPDTFIDFIAYFRPLSVPYADLAPLVLPQEPPLRIGFTAVEWGGAIDY